MKHFTGDKKWRVIIGILITCIFIGGIYLFLSAAGILQLFQPSVSMEVWPAYNEEYRLDTGGELPELEELAYYIATKIPDQHKAGLEKIYITDRYEALELAPAPGYVQGTFPAYCDPPYKDSIVVSEGVAVEVRLKYKTGTVVCSPHNLYTLLEAHSDCFFAAVQVQKDHRTTGTSSGNYVSAKHYKTHHPDYVVQSN